jgi:hypothetical protein
VWIAAERGRVARARNDRTTAVRAYSFVLRAWQHGDPEAQPLVKEARDVLRTLGAGSEADVTTAARPAHQAGV